MQKQYVAPNLIAGWFCSWLFKNEITTRTKVGEKVGHCCTLLHIVLFTWSSNEEFCLAMQKPLIID